MILSLSLAASSLSSGQWQGGDRPQTGGSRGRGGFCWTTFSAFAGSSSSLPDCSPRMDFDARVVFALISLRSWASLASVADFVGEAIAKPASGMEDNVVVPRFLGKF